LAQEKRKTWLTCDVELKYIYTQIEELMQRKSDDTLTVPIQNTRRRQRDRQNGHIAYYILTIIKTISYKILTIITHILVTIINSRIK